MESNKNKGIGFRLKGIKIEQFATFEENFNVNIENELLTSFKVKISEQDKQIGIFAGFEFKQSTTLFMKLVVSCHFGITENTWEMYSSPEGIVLPKEFVAHLVMITVGTSRGILYAKTESTPFSKFILPMIDVVSKLDERIIFPMNT